MDFFNNNETTIHDCIIAVDEKGTGILLKSTPSLYEFDQFDGNDLEDNLTGNKNIPTEFGIYRCKIKHRAYSYFTGEFTEHDVDCTMSDIEKIDLPI